MSLDWLILGGGIHGVHIAVRLIGEAGIAPDRLRIVDPCSRLLARWRACTAATGMTFLRSPAVHHLDLHPWALKHFVGGRRKRRKPGFFAEPYGRPALRVFDAHCDRVVDSYGLRDLHVRDRAIRCSVDGGGVGVRLSSGRELEGHNLVLAIGAGEQPEWPEWAPRGNPFVRHIFEPGFDGWTMSKGTVAVVGGGISAGQVALRLMREGHRVHLVSRHALRRHQFDSDAGWLGPKLMTAFSRERDHDRRRALIADARHRGSVPPDVRLLLRQAIVRRQIGWHQDGVEGLDVRSDGIDLRLSGNIVLEVDHLLLATGFDTRRPGGSMVDDLIESASLRVARCGYPIVDTALRWHPRVHVSGPLAELELGPTSRNIAGARRAADRIVDEILLWSSSRRRAS